jgi:hypothetical protein
MGPWLLTLILGKDLAAVRKFVQMVQLKLHFCELEHVLVFGNHGVFLGHTTTEQDDGEPVQHLGRTR